MDKRDRHAHATAIPGQIYSVKAIIILVHTIVTQYYFILFYLQYTILAYININIVHVFMILTGRNLTRSAISCDCLCTLIHGMFDDMFHT